VDPSTTGALDLVERGIGSLDERVRGRPILGERDPDGDADVGTGSFDVERISERGEQPVGDMTGSGSVGHVSQQHRELIAADPRELVTRAQAGAQAGRDLHENDVADVVAVVVVDRLEVVEIAECNRHVSLTDRQRLGQPSAELRTVGHARQRVVPGQVSQTVVLRGAHQCQLDVLRRTIEGVTVPDERWARRAAPHRQHRRSESRAQRYRHRPARPESHRDRGCADEAWQARGLDVRGDRNGRQRGVAPRPDVESKLLERRAETRGTREGGAIEPIVHDRTFRFEGGGDRSTQRGEHVVQRFVGEQRGDEPVEPVLLVPSAFAKHDHVVDARHIEQGDRTDLDPHELAVGAPDLEHHRHALALAIDLLDLRDRFDGEFDLVGGQEVHDVLAGDLFREPSEQALDRTTRIPNEAVRRDDDERIRRHVHDHLEHVRGKIACADGHGWPGALLRRRFDR